MTPPADPGHGGEPQATAYRNQGIRSLLAMFEHGDPEQPQPLGEILEGLQESAFGMFLFIAILPSFIPIPGIAGAVSGPLVMLIGLQMLCGLGRPWVPGFIARHGPKRGTMQRVLGRLGRPLRRLDRMLKPRLQALLWPLPSRMFSGLLMVVVGVLLSLPIPFTNYLFGFQLLLFALALIERDGALMLFNWLAGIAAAVFFGLGSGQLLGRVIDLLRGWLG